jgi:hypothetical protein
MTNNNAYDRVTERILDLMQRGTCPWRQPWSTHFDPPQNFATGRHYSGMNFFMLSMSGYQSPYFLTFRQIQERGGNVDSFNRYIYIHGTNLEDRIGRPASHGCVTLPNREMLELYDAVPEGTLVYIARRRRAIGSD